MKLKSINLKDVAYWVASVWVNVGAKTIGRSCYKLLSNDEVIDASIPEEVLENILPLVQRIPGCEGTSLNEVDNWLSADNQYEISDEEIIALVNSDDAEDLDCETTQPQKITHNKGVKALEAAIQYVEQQEEARAVDIMMLQRWRDLAAKKRESVGKQQEITSFFTHPELSFYIHCKSIFFVNVQYCSCF